MTCYKNHGTKTIYCSWSQPWEDTRNTFLAHQITCPQKNPHLLIKVSHGPLGLEAAAADTSVLNGTMVKSDY